MFKGQVQAGVVQRELGSLSTGGNFILPPHSTTVVQGVMPLGRVDFLPRQKGASRGQPEVDVDVDEQQFPYQGVSSKHAVLIPRPDGVMLQDLGSANGCWRNGERLNEHTLLPWEHLSNTIICLGAPCFTVRFMPLTEVFVRENEHKPKIGPIPMPTPWRFWMVIFGMFKRNPTGYVLVTGEKGEGVAAADDHEHTMMPGHGRSYFDQPLGDLLKGSPGGGSNP